MRKRKRSHGTQAASKSSRFWQLGPITGSKSIGDRMHNTKADKLRNYTIIARLDDAIPINTDEWMSVEQLLNQISEFVPLSMLNNLTEAIVAYADDQARRGYLLGQEDLVSELKKKAAKIA